MATADDVLGRYDAWIDERTLQVREIVLARRWRRGIEWDVAALGEDAYLVALDHAIRDGGTKGIPDRPLGSLAAVVDRRIDDVDAALERGTNGRSVAGVVSVVALAQVGADPER